jgi:hypothetical protein
VPSERISASSTSRPDEGGGRIGAAQRGECLVEPVVQRAELEEVEQPLDLVRVGRAHQEVGRLQLDGCVAHQAHDLFVAAHPGLDLGVGQGRPQLGGLLVDVLEQAVEAAVGVDELRRGLLADTGHAGKVVARVAAQRRVRDVERRRDARLLGDAGFVVERVVADAAPVVEDLDVRVLDELVAVAVARDHDRLDALVARPGREGGDDVVGLVAGELDHRHRQRGEHLAHQAHLLAEDVGCRRSVGLVGLDRLVAERRLGPVEGHGDVIGLVITQQVDQHRGEPEHRVGDLTSRGRHVGGQGEERAIRQRVPVDQHQLRHAPTLFVGGLVATQSPPTRPSPGILQ